MMVSGIGLEIQMQKFFRGDLVRLADDFPIYMSHFPGAGSLAVVESVTKTGSKFSYELHVILKKGDIEEFETEYVKVPGQAAMLRRRTGNVTRVTKARVAQISWYDEELLTLVSEEGAQALPKSNPLRKEYEAKLARRRALLGRIHRITMQPAAIAEVAPCWTGLGLMPRS